MKIVYSKDSLKFLAKAEKSVVQRIRSAIEGLTLKPAIGDIKVMQGLTGTTWISMCENTG